jgi:hypothetical protein
MHAQIYRGVVLGASVVIGFGAAILWVALGAFLTANADEGDRGRVSGIFWCIFNMCNVFGNLVRLAWKSRSKYRADYAGLDCILSVLVDFRRACVWDILCHLGPRDCDAAVLAAGTEDDERCGREHCGFLSQWADKLVEQCCCGVSDAV